jgi:hypothetical protein
LSTKGIGRDAIGEKMSGAMGKVDHKGRVSVVRKLERK